MIPGAFNNEHAQDDYPPPEFEYTGAPYPINQFYDPSMATQSDQFWDAVIADMLASTDGPPLSEITTHPPL